MKDAIDSATGNSAEMLKWMEEIGTEADKIEAFKKELEEKNISVNGIAPKCTRQRTGTCGYDDSCIEYTITCCTYTENGGEICSSTTVCKCG